MSIASHRYVNSRGEFYSLDAETLAESIFYEDRFEYEAPAHRTLLINLALLDRELCGLFDVFVA